MRALQTPLPIILSLLLFGLDQGYCQKAFSLPTPFSSGFRQPDPPLIHTAFQANWNQHKWDVQVSNIASGFLYVSPSNQRVRADVASDAGFESSLFDYRSMTSDGLVANTLYTLKPSIASKPQCTSLMVNPGFPLFPADVLVTGNAVYGGTMEDELHGIVSIWDILYQGLAPTTIYLNSENSIVGYNLFSPNLRTRVITKFFNIILSETNGTVFDFPMTC